MTGPSGAAPGATVGNTPDAMVDAVITAVAAPVKVASLFVAIADGVSGSPSQKKSSGSRFVGDAPQKQRPEPTPLVPRSYSEKVAVVKQTAKGAGKRLRDGNVFTSARLAGMSLTGADSGGGSSNKTGSPIKGLKIAATATKKLTDLTKDLAATLHARDGVNRYDGSSKRLGADLKKGSPLAQEVVVNNPNVRPRAFSGGMAS